MKRSPLRYVAVVGVVAGALLMSGAGAVAFAGPDDGSAGGVDGGTTGGTVEPGTTGGTLTGVPPYGPSGSPYNTPVAGPVPVPKFNIPSRLGLLTLPGANTPPRFGPITLPDFRLPDLGLGAPPPGAGGGLPAGQLPNDTTPAGTAPTTTALPNGTAWVQADQPATGSPTLSFLPLVPEGVPTGTPITIHNPLPDSLPIDLHKPLGPQLVPPAIVQILIAISQQIPLADLIVSPLMNDVLVPSVISDVLVPALLSDFVIPTLPLGGTLPGTTLPGVAPTSHVAALVLPGNPPPLDIAPGGMDVSHGPVVGPAPLPQPAGAEVLPEPKTAPASPNNATALSEPVAFRAGYSDYLRNAGMAQITSLALPGIVGILLVTAGGGFIGYRQARAGHVIRAEGIGRFLR